MTQTDSPDQKRLWRWLHAWRDRYAPADWPALRVLLAVQAVLQLSAIGWDLPASFEWENDAVAPRDFFAGIALNLPPGPGHTYPLLHNLLLGLVNLPTLLISALTAPSWQPDALMRHVLDYPTMTAVYLAAKLLAVAMGLLALAALARLTARLWNRRAAQWAVAWAIVNVSVAYYGRTANLDGPYLCWMALAAERLLDVVEFGNLRDYKVFALLVAASIATKDQAYAAWLLPGPIVLVIWPALAPRALAAGKNHWKFMAIAIPVGALGLAAMGGALWNPPGFVHRLQTLAGPASQDWRIFPATLAGLRQNILELLKNAPDHWWPLPVLALALAGLLAQARGPLLRLLPLLLGLSYVLGFTLVVGRAGHRFTLPLGFWLAAYLGVASAWLTERWAVRALIPLQILWLWPLAQTLTVEVTQWRDARRPVEAWLAQLPPHTRVIATGGTVTQPRWGRPALAHLDVARVGPTPPGNRNPLLGVTELQGNFMDIPAMQPDVIVFSSPPDAELPLPPPQPGAATSLPQFVQREQADGSRDFVQLALANRVPGYEATRVRTGLPAWMTALGLAVGNILSSVGNDEVVLLNKNRRFPPLLR